LFSNLYADDTSDSKNKNFSVGIIGGLVYDSPTLSSNSFDGLSFDTSGNAVFGGGLTLEMALMPTLSLEGDIFYIKKSFSRDTAEFFGVNVASTTSSGTVQIPVLLRFRPLSFLNTGFGFYYSRVVSSWSVSADNYSSSEVNYGKNEYGLVFALGTGVAISETMNIVADLRYTRSLTDSGASTNKSLKFSQLQIFAGLRLDI
jgi:hypothetical protein